MDTFAEDEISLESYSDFLVDIINLEYFNKNKYDRYLRYHESKPEFSSSEVVFRVNVNLDQEFYISSIKYNDVSEDNLAIMVNKYYQLPADYIPSDIVEVKYNGNPKPIQIRSVIKDSLDMMFSNGEELGYQFYITTAYRSYSFQEYLYTNYVARDGMAAADQYSARPGHSEHQLGLAIDISVVGEPGRLKDDTDNGNWLHNNAHKYGFILRYPEGREDITGYMYEPWHFRYVGKELAQLLYENNWTLEEYYGRREVMK